LIYELEDRNALAEDSTFIHKRSHASPFVTQCMKCAQYSFPCMFSEAPHIRGSFFLGMQWNEWNILKYFSQIQNYLNCMPIFNSKSPYLYSIKL